MTQFTHLHVASGCSMQYGASSPDEIVTRAVELGLSSLALTDRDGLYGAVKFVTACDRAGITPLLGTDLAVEPSGLLPGEWARHNGWGRRLPGPVRGGASVDPRLPRVTVLAHGAGGGGPAGAGWARLCRLVSAMHLRGERGVPVATTALVGEHACSPAPAASSADDEPALTVLLGPDSEIGRAILARRADVARAVLAHWYDALPLGALAIEVVCHEGPPGTPASLGHAAAMLSFARQTGLPAVLTNAVRYTTPDGAITADVLDAARRLVPLSVRNTDRTTSRAHLAGAAEMTALAHRVADAAGDPGGGNDLLAQTERIAARCRLDPAADLGIGRVHLPEPAVVVPGWTPDVDVNHVLRGRCEAGIGRRYPGASAARWRDALDRLDDELATVSALGYATYFLTVAEVCDLIREMDVRVAARGSGAGSLVNYLLGISGVDPLAHGLQMERFCTPLRAELPDIDIDVESARRTDVYEQILERFGSDRVSCVSMMDTYRVRHAVRDVGAALGMPQAEIDAIAKAFPHIRAKDARGAIAELPELRASGLGNGDLALFFELVERLDALPRHIALHPCGVLLSDATLGDRTPVETSWQGFPMSQFDKDDVEVLGLLKLDVLGVRMQSAMAHALAEIERVDGADATRAGGHDANAPYLDPATGRIDLDAVPLDDETTFRLIRSTRTLGCFQIESPGQRELVGKFAPQTFADLIVDISLFRPGPVKSDMVTPFLRARQGWEPPDYLHPRLREPLEQTYGVVVFHEQVIDIVAITADVSRAEADEVRRALGSPTGQAEVEAWWRSRALERGFSQTDVDRVWEVLKAFASFGFCKAHAAAFALPTYQSAWLKARHPAAFLAGVLTHDPGMYPKRLILDDARNLGIAILGLDVNASGEEYRVEKVDGRAYGIRLSLADVKGISDAEVERIVAGQPYHSLADFWHRSRVSRPIAERLVIAGAFDSLYGLGSTVPVRRRGQATRRDLLLQLAELERWTRGVRRGAPRGFQQAEPGGARDQGQREVPVQLALELGDQPDETVVSGLPEMTSTERVRAELEVLGLDASRHVVDFYTPLLNALGVTRSTDLVRRRSRSELLVAGVKVATQTPPIRSGRRVVFLTLDDSFGPVDATFFEDVQGPYAATVFGSWLLLVRGELRRTGPRGVSLRATGAWELPELWEAWSHGGLTAVHEVMAAERGFTEDAVVGAAASRSTRPVMATPPSFDTGDLVRFGGSLPAQDRQPAAVARRVLVHASGFRQSPYADVKPPGDDVKDTRSAARKEAPRKLWHSSPGSSGR